MDATRSEKTVRCAAQMYEFREMMRRLWGAKYQEQIDPFKRIIKGKAAKENMSDLGATIALMQENMGRNPQWVPAFAAAFVELAEEE